MAKRTQKDEIRELAENDLWVFATLTNPMIVFGDIHKKLFYWWMELEERGVMNSGVLLPRDHLKSRCSAIYAAWKITRNPAATILYVSATSALAEKQLKSIKDVITSDVYRRYWPEMVNIEEGKREMWNNSEICVDHPTRKKERVRDSSVFAAGLTTNITGFHASDVFLDDIVVPNNAYTEEGRETVRKQYSQLASIETAGASEVVVGTRYHPLDIYQDLMDMTEEEFDDDMEIIGHKHVYEFMVKTVEEDGEFLWPKQARRTDGKMFGFDARELARKKAKYLDVSQFYAQYYQETNHASENRLDFTNFQYYDPKHLRQYEGDWFFQDKKLNVYAAIDFAFSLSSKADYTAIVVIGIDEDGYIYLLDIDRFRANKVKQYFEHLMALYNHWEFRKLRAEVSVAQSVIVNDLKDLVIQSGARFSIDQSRPIKDKEERIASILEHRYENGSVLHFKGGYVPMLEEELVKVRPAHDDIKDSLASAVEIAVKPVKRRLMRENNDNNVIYHPRFGGVAHV